MGRTIKVMAAVALLLALTAGMALAAAPEGNDHAKAKPEVELSPRQHAEFVAGAKKVAGLNSAQITAALKNPATLAAVPVRAEVRTSETEPTARAQEDRAGESFSATATSYCRRFASTVNYTNAYGTLLASYKVSRVWCWDYSAITYVSVPEVSGTVTARGAALGWRYNGLIARSDAYFYYDGRSRGGHVSRRKGSFSVCNASSGCFLTKTPQVSIFGYYDGRGYQKSSA